MSELNYVGTFEFRPTLEEVGDQLQSEFPHMIFRHYRVFESFDAPNVLGKYTQRKSMSLICISTLNTRATLSVPRHFFFQTKISCRSIAF